MSSTENERDSGQESDHEKNSGNPVPRTSTPNERKRQAVAVKMDEQTKRIKMMLDDIGEQRALTADVLARNELLSLIGRSQGPPQLPEISIVSAPSNNETTQMDTTSGDTLPTNEVNMIQEPGANGERERATRSPTGHVHTQQLHHGLQPVPNLTLPSPSSARVNNPPSPRESHLLAPRAGIQNVESNGRISRFVVDIRHNPSNGHGNVHYHFHF